MPPRLGMLQRTSQGRRHTDKQKKDDQAIKIGEKLYMGSIDAAQNGEHLKAAGITHILSVLSSDCLKQTDEAFTIKTVLIDDVERAGKPSYAKQFDKISFLCLERHRAIILTFFSIKRSHICITTMH